MRPAPRLLLCAFVLACGDPPTIEAPPPIEVSERRCGPQQLPALNQPRRILPLPGDRLGILGLNLRAEDERGFVANGAWVVLDPTSGAPPVVELTERPIFDGLVKGDAVYLLEKHPLESTDDRGQSVVYRRPIARFADAREAVNHGRPWTHLTVGFNGFVASGDWRHYGGISRALMGFSTPSRGGDEFYWGRMRGPVAWVGMSDENGPILWLPKIERLIVLGWLHAPGDPDDPDDPGEHFGFTMTQGRTIDDWGRRIILPLSYKLHRQREFEPFAAVTDRAGDPWLLAVEGHSGDRYRHARPFMVRLDPRTHQWTARIDPELPPAATQGAVLDAVSLADGGWIIGGAACDEDREWCRAWVARLDRGGRTVWSRETSREKAMVVRDLHVAGDKIYAAIAGGPYCCQFEDIDYTAWLWTLDLDEEGCAEPR